MAHLILWIIAAMLLITLAGTHFRLIEWLSKALRDFETPASKFETKSWGLRGATSPKNETL